MTKDRANKRFDMLRKEYMHYDASFRDLSKYLNPTRGKFSSSDLPGKMIDHKTIIDDHATHSIRILASGMQSGMTSPSRPWFRLNDEDKYLNKQKAVREWLDDTSDRMLDVIANSNTYDSFYSLYEELGQFATACAIVLEDYDNVVRVRTFTAGEYALGCNAKGEVDRFCREFILTVSQCVESFGIDKCSSSVQSAWGDKRYEDKVTVRNLIEPNDTAQRGYVDNKNMPIRSVYWEVGGDDKLLDERGFMEFPVLAPRWDTVTTSNVYGYGPGWFALGNVKQLQKTVLDKLIAQEKIHKPPMLEDSSVQGISNYLPGGKTKVNNLSNNSGARPAYEIDVRLESFQEMIQGLKDAIDKTFYVNIFLMMINFDKTNMTATEVAEREQENVMMMGPLLNRVNKELLSKYLAILYGIMDRNGLLAEPPEEIRGHEIRIEFVSILAQAQKAVGANSIDRVLSRIGNLATIKPNVVDNINEDETAREYCSLEGVPAKLLHSESTVKKIREQRAREQAMQNNIAAAQTAAKAAKDAAGAKLEDDNVLSRMAGAV